MCIRRVAALLQRAPGAIIPLYEILDNIVGGQLGRACAMAHQGVVSIRGRPRRFVHTVYRSVTLNRSRTVISVPAFAVEKQDGSETSDALRLHIFNRLERQPVEPS